MIAENKSATDGDEKSEPRLESETNRALDAPKAHRLLYYQPKKLVTAGEQLTGRTAPCKTRRNASTQLPSVVSLDQLYRTLPNLLDVTISKSSRL